MKLFKKAAALFFCLALALSVMAVTALAADPVFTLTLEQATEYADNDGVSNSGIEVGTSNGKNAVTYNMKLKCDTTPQNVSAFSFKVANVAGMETAVVFYEGANSTATQSAETTAYNGGTIYSFSSTATSTKDFPLNTQDTDVTIGQITFTFGNAANHTSVTPTLSEINLSTRDDVFNKDKYDVNSTASNSATTPTVIQVNPIYAMTFKEYTVNETTGVKNATSNDTTLYYDYEGTIYSDATGSFALSNGFASSVKPTAYDYTDGFTSGWKVITVGGVAGSCGWTVNAPQAAANAFSDNRVGAVTLEAQYTAITYHYTYVFGDGTTNNEDATYTVENITAFRAAPTWTGYDFKGWSATQDNAYNHSEFSSEWTSYATAPNYTEGTDTGLMSAAPTQNAYGDVTLTAVWDEAGQFKAATYAYAGSNNALILYAVESTNYSDKDTYYYTLAENDSRAMFKVPAAKLAKYIGEFTQTQQSALGESYAMFAYIAPATGAAKGKVTVTKGAESDTSANVELAYTGNVYRGSDGNDNAINTADYGNVDALLAANGGTASATAFTQSDVRARLEADVVNVGDKVGETEISASTGDGASVQNGEVYYGSIWDIKAIFANLT